LTLFSNPEDPKAIDFWYSIDAATNSMKMAVRAPTQGWIGFGVAASAAQPQMIGSEAVIAWVDDGSRAAEALGYRLGDKDASAFVDITSELNIREVSGCQDTTSTIVRFTRNLSSGNGTSGGILNPIISTGGVTNGFVNSFNPADWNAAALGTNSAHDFDARAFASFDVTSPLIIGGSPTPIRQAHGALMFLGWGVFLQFGAIFARYAKKFPNSLWFTIHRPIQTIGYIIALIGFILATVMTHPAHYVVQPHTGLGLTVMILGMVQMTLVMFRPDPPAKGDKPTCGRRIFEFQHWYTGRAALILAVITIFFGFRAIGAGVGLYIAYGVFVGVEFIAYVVLEVLRLMKRDSEDRGCY
jgi:hypothetical protein